MLEIPYLTEPAQVLGTAPEKRPRGQRRKRRGIVVLESPQDAIDLLSRTLEGLHDKTVSPAQAQATERVVGRYIEVSQEYEKSSQFASLADQRRATSEGVDAYLDQRKKDAVAEADALIDGVKCETKLCREVVKLWCRSWSDLRAKHGLKGADVVRQIDQDGVKEGVRSAESYSETGEPVDFVETAE